jgi:hypothetical protein
MTNMNEDGYKDDFHSQVAGTLIAFRIAINAIMKTHPEPEKLLASIKETVVAAGSPEGNLPAPIQVVFDEVLLELTSHLRANS